MAQEYIVKDYSPCITGLKDFDEDPTTENTRDWILFGGNAAFPGPKTDRQESERVRGSRQHHEDDVFITDKGVPQVIDNIPAFDVRKTDLILWLYAFYQNVSTTGEDPYYHKFHPVSPNPDFFADAGFLLNYMLYHPLAGRSWIAANCIVTQLTIKISYDNFGHRVTVQPQLLARKIFPLDTPFSTTIAESAGAWWNWHDLQDTYGEVLVGADAPDFYEAEIVLGNGGMGRSQDVNGRPLNFILGDFTGSATISVLKRALDSDDWIADWLANTATGISFQFFATDLGIAGDLLINLNGKFNEIPPPEAGPSNEQRYNCAFECLNDASNDSSAITVINAEALANPLFLVVP